MTTDPVRLSRAELEAECGALLPAKEVLSVPLLDLNVDLDLALALAAPIDLAVAANANVALPIDAAVSANALSVLSNATAVATQGVMIDQFISGEAIAEGNQTSDIDQTHSGTTAPAVAPAAASAVPAAATAAAGTGEVATQAEDVAPAAVAPALAATPATESVQPTETAPPTTETAPATTETAPAATETAPATSAGEITPTVDVVQPEQLDAESLLEGGLLSVDVNVALDADIAAPIAGAVAANANVAAPIDAAVAANVASIGSEAIAAADQTAIITQRLEDVTAEATVDQDSEIDQ
jgi:hypothetical protein